LRRKPDQYFRIHQSGRKPDLFGKPEEAASLAGFLCSDEASCITGEIIGVDGGMMKVQNPGRAYEFARRLPI
jgi:NAD(P)-dependent dehydrogenase (short-subunit alcohol dehydrogenase family)